MTGKEQCKKRSKAAAAEKDGIGKSEAEKNETENGSIEKTALK